MSSSDDASSLSRWVSVFHKSGSISPRNGATRSSSSAVNSISRQFPLKWQTGIDSLVISPKGFSSVTSTSILYGFHL